MNKQRKTSHILNVFQYDDATGIIGLNGAPVSGYGLYLTTNINDGSVGIDSSASINALYLLKNTTKQFEISYDTSGATKLFRLLPYQSGSFFQIGNPSNAANSNSDYVFISESVYGNVLIGPGIGNAVSNLTGATASIHKVQFNGAVFANNSIQATSFKITGGASTGFLKADGTVDAVTYLSGNQSITVSGDATGSGTTSIALTLANTAVTPGTYGSTTLVPVVTVDSKGRITSVTTAAISGSLTFTGDVTGSGTTGTSTAMTLAASGVTAGTYTKVTVDSKGRVTVGASATTSDISEGTNLYYTDARVLSYLSANTYATQSYVNTQVSNLVAAAPATLDTLNELAAALGNDPSFATTISTALGNRLRVDINNQGLSATLQGYGRTNLGLGTAATSNTGDFVAYRTFGTAANSAIGDFVAYRTFGTAANNNTGDFATAAQGTKADSAYGWGNHASGGYLTSATAATTYVSLTGSYANPAWITSLAYSKITGVPAFLTSYTETDPYRVTTVAVSGTSTKTITLTRADASTVTTTWTDYDTDTNTYVTSAGFSGGNLTLTRNDTGQITVSLDGRYYLATNPSQYITGISFANVSSKPTTISGYGITDAITTGNIASQSVSYASSTNLLNSLSNYVWSASTLPSGYNAGIQTSFVSASEGFPSYGSVLTNRTYTGSEGGTLQLFTPYGPAYGGTRLGFRSGIYETGAWSGWKYLLNDSSDPYAANMNQYVRTTDNVNFNTVTISGKITTAVTNGTIISHGSMTDAFGYNNSYGTYIGSVVGGTYYIYGNGQMYNNGTIVTLYHTGNIPTWNQNTTGTAGSISGFNNPTTSPTANTIMYRDGSGYVQAVYYYSSNAGRETTGINSLTGKISAGAGYMYEFTAAAVQTWLGLGSLAYSSATIPTNNNQLTNGAGYITSSGSISGNAGTVTNGVYTNVTNTMTNGDAASIIVWGSSTYTSAAALHIGGWSTDTTYARIRTSNGNLHIDTRGGAGNLYQMYFNHYSSGDMYFGNGGGTVNIYGGRLQHSNGTAFVYNSGTWSINVTGSAGSAAQVTHNASRADAAWYNVGWFAGASSPAYSSDSVMIQSSTGTIRANAFYDNQDTTYYLDPNSTTSAIFRGSIGLNTTTPVNSAWGNASTTTQLSMYGSGYSVINLRGDNGGTARTFSMGVGDNRFYMCYDNTAARHNLIIFSDGRAEFAGAITGSNLSGTNTGDQTNISGNAATATYATNSTRLYASDAPYTYGGAAPYYMFMTYDGTRWFLQVSPATPAAVRVSYADSAGSTSSASTAGTVTHYASRTDTAWYNVVWASGNPSYMYSSDAVMIRSSDGALRANIFYDNQDLGYFLDPTASGTSLRIAGNIYSDGSFGSNGYSSSSPNVVSRIFAPKGGAFSSDGSTGAIRIKLPFRGNNPMWTMKVRIYNYATNQTSEYLLGNYAYDQGGYNSSATFIGGNAAAPLIVRFGNQDGVDCVWIGETNTSWSYPVVSVLDFTSGFRASDGGSQGTGWNVSIVTSFGTIGTTISPSIRFSDVYTNSLSVGGNAVIHAGNIGSQSVSYASSASSATTATNFNNGYAYSSGSTVYVDTLESISATDWLELTYYGGLGVRIGTGANGSKALYAGSLYDAGNRVYSAANPQVNISGNAGSASTVTGSSTMSGYLTISSNWGVSNYTSALTVIGTYPSMTLRNSSADWEYLMHNDGAGDLQFYFGPGYTTNNWTQRYTFGRYGDFYVRTGTITASGDITAYSDIRVKENIEVIENALEKVKAIRGVTFNRTDLENDKGSRHAGVIAQEVLQVLPEVVKTNDKGMYSVAYGNMVGLLIEAIKEQQGQIEELKNKLDNVLSSR